MSGDLAVSVAGRILWSPANPFNLLLHQVSGCDDTEIADDVKLIGFAQLSVS